MRPTTSNPKRRTSSLNSPLHKSTTPRGEHATNIEDLTAEVLWSDEHSVPASMLARPHTSNPRYAEMNLRDTPRKDVPHSSGSAPDSVVTSAPSCTPSEPSPERNVSLPDHITAVLWASDSVNIEPNLLARPVTANPWLRRLFESGSLPEANWTRKESQILWSSIDVEDWRMLARPHASNPLLERGIGDDSSVPQELTPIAAHTHGEVLWQRDDDPTATEEAAAVASSNTAAAAARHTASENLVSSAVTPVLTAAMETIKLQSDKIDLLEGEVRQLRLAVQELSALVHRSFALQNHQPTPFYHPQYPFPPQPQSQHYPLPHAHAATMPAASRGWPATAPAVGCAPEARTVRDTTSGALEYPCAVALNSSTGTGSLVNSVGYIPDPSVGSSQVPTLRPEYPAFHAPSPPRREAGPLSDALDPPATTQCSEVKSSAYTTTLDDDAFVKEDDGAIEPQLEGLSARAPPSVALRPESAQVRPGHASSRIVQDLRNAVDGARPQSAPLHSYIDRKSGKVARPTTYFAKDGSNALLLNNKAIVDQYQALIQPGHPFALKEDFKAMYLKKSSEFGMCVNEREIDRKLATFHTVGKDYLSLEEFSVLFLHIAQW